MKHSAVSHNAAIEETFFLGLRLASGIELDRVEAKFGAEVVAELASVLTGWRLLDCWSARRIEFA